jgi:DNA polymerase-3 subunit delta'
VQFKDVIGQEELKQHLINEVKNDRISHAQLFLGKAGYGGLPLAFAFIQYLFCEQRNDFDSCGTCASCNKVAKLQHPDLHFSFPSVQAISKTSDALYKEWREQVTASPYFDLGDWIEKIDSKGRSAIISTDESQNIIKKLALKSFEGREKVCLMWMADKMNATCANKMLKILEEPPAKTIFILIAESQEAMLPTIISRTQILNVKALKNADIAVQLQAKIGLPEEKAVSIAAFSEHDYLKALNVASQNSSQQSYRESFIQWMRLCYGKDVVGMMNWAEEIAANGKIGQLDFLTYALHMMRQSVLSNYTGEDLLTVSDEEYQFLTKFGKFITGNNIIDFNEKLSEAQYHIERNANAKILFTNLSFQVMKLLRAN